MFCYIPSIISELYKTDEYTTIAADDSMSPKIKNGDIVYCQPNIKINNGNIVHFSFDNQSGFRKYFINEDQTIISLIPINPKYETIVINHSDNYKLLIAKVTGKIDKNF